MRFRKEGNRGTGELGNWRTGELGKGELGNWELRNIFLGRRGKNINADW